MLTEKERGRNMEKNEKGGHAANPEEQDKGSNYSLTYKCLQIFLSGQRVTAFGLNQNLLFNDARKRISILRRLGYPIQDFRLSDQRKCYFLPNDWEQIKRAEKQGFARQLTLFGDDTDGI